jgi:cyclic pyranopterin phosphate synthase
LSLTERCNLACAYCVPHDHEAAPADWLTDDEVVALCAALRPLGIEHVRLSGGEPTLRPRLLELVGRLAALGIEDLSLTTNGTRLVELAAPLRAAGLRRLNISLDTLSAARFAALCGDRARWHDVVAGIDAVVACGFSDTKLNVVALAGINDDELPALAQFAWARDLVPRFIELMPMADGVVAPRARFVPAATIRARLAEALGPLETSDGALPGVGPARYLRVASGVHRGRQLGVISAVTEPFCTGCNRFRISARGLLQPCLGQDDLPDAVDLRVALRSGPEAVRKSLRTALESKAPGHGFLLEPARLVGGPRRSMIVLGG